MTDSYRSRMAGWHLQCCQAYAVAVRRETQDWWRSEATAAGITFHTGGRTRRHAETNALALVNAPLFREKVSFFDPYDDGPS